MVSLLLKMFDEANGELRNNTANSQQPTLTKLFVLFLFVFQSACLPKIEENGSSTDSNTPVAPAGFNGAEKANGMSPNSIEVSWESPTTSQDIGAYEVFELNSSNQLVSLGIVSVLTTAYTHVGLPPESSHRYVVRGLYNTDKKDNNFRIVTSSTLSNQSGGGIALAINPISKTLEYSKAFTFTTSGGVPPYTYAALSGPGVIDPNTGEFASLATAGSVTIRVKDAQGAASYATVSVVAGFTVSPTDRQLKLERTTEIKAVGAKEPVTYQITTGAGLATIDGSGKYTAGSMPGVTVVKVTDADGLTKESVITLVTEMTPHDNMLLSGGRYSTCYTEKGSQEVRCWGVRRSGMLGEPQGTQVGDQAGEMGDALIAVDFGTTAAVVDVKSSRNHSCVKFADGKMKCWGDGGGGKLLSGSSADMGEKTSTLGDNLPFLNFGTNSGTGLPHTVKDFSLGHQASCAILEDDRLKCWGNNYQAQAGLEVAMYYGDAGNETGAALSYVNVGAGRTVKMVATQYRHTCAILDNDEVKCWGEGSYGKLGFPTTDQVGDAPGEMASLDYVDLGGGRTAKFIAVGAHHSCVILDNDEVKCWGYNSHGQLGLGDTNRRGDNAGEMAVLPTVDLGTGRTAKALALGENHTCAILDNDKLKCWGIGSYGDLGSGSSGHIGNVPGQMGNNLPYVDLGDGITASKIYAEYYKTCALLNTGDVKCWGRNELGQLGVGDSNNRGASPGEMGNSLLKIDVGTGRTVQAFGTANNISCALLNNGEVKCWGGMSEGRLGRGDGIIGDVPGEMGIHLAKIDFGSSVAIEKIASGEASHCVLFTDGRVKCWGNGFYGALFHGSNNTLGDNPNEVGAAQSFSNFGTVGKVIDIQLGYYFGCVLFDIGKVKCWGFNDYGELGLVGVTNGAGTLINDGSHQGDTASELGDNLPFLDFGLNHTVKQLSVGRYHSCVVLDNDKVKCWGDNTEGRLGYGDTNQRGASPGEMGDNLDYVDLGESSPGQKHTVKQVVAMGSHTCAVLEDDRIKCWGYNQFGQVGVENNQHQGDGPGEMGDNLPYVDLGNVLKPIDLVGGDHFTCALFSDEKMKCWGLADQGRLARGTSGQIGNNPGEMGDNLPFVNVGTDRSVVKLLAPSSSGLHMCALLDNQDIKCWGYNDYGQLGLGHTNHMGDNSNEIGDQLPAVEVK